MALIGLEGTGDKVFDTPIFFWDTESALRIMHAFGAATAANDYGAITVWEDTGYNLHCEFSHKYYAVSKERFEDIDELRAWLDKWIPAIGDKSILDSLIKSQEE